MYETLEHWKQYKQEKDLQTKIAEEFKLNEEINFKCSCTNNSNDELWSNSM